MARARNIKPSFFSNDRLGEVTPLARLLFIGLWGLVDREGKLEDRPKRIKAEVLPYDNCDVDELLDLLDPEFIVRYTADGIACIQVLNFLKHQNPHPKERESVLPNMPGNSNAANRCDQDEKINGKDKPINFQTHTCKLKLCTSPAESLLLNPESLLLNPDCCSPRNEVVDEDNNQDEGVVAKKKTNQVATMVIGTQAVKWAEKNWGRMIPKGESDSIIAWCDEFSIRGSEDPDAVVIEALRCCLDADARNMQYLRAVVTDWRKVGILTTEHVVAREAERKKHNEHKWKKESGNKLRKTASDKYDNFYL